MPGSTIIKGSARKALVQETAISVTGSGGTSFGVFKVGLYSRLAGIVSIIGSGTLRYQMGIDSANFVVTSSTIINSGASVFDFLNYGHAVGLSFSQLASQTGAKILIMGEPTR